MELWKLPNFLQQKIANIFKNGLQTSKAWKMKKYENVDIFLIGCYQSCFDYVNIVSFDIDKSKINKRFYYLFIGLIKSK